MKNLLIILVALTAMACGDDTEIRTAATEGVTPGSSMNMGKADDASESQQGDAEAEPEIDLCAEFELYGDEECHTFCSTPDPDCTEEELEAARDICEEEDRYGDGQCDEDCHYYDSDCDEPADLCQREARYADGTCDTDCAYTDSDCDDYEALSATEITDEEASICERYTGGSRVAIQEIASALCMEREDASVVDCIAQCVDAFSSN